MKKRKGEMRESYQRSDFAKLERGKFYKEAEKGTAVALLEPAVARAFRTSADVNEALKGLLALAERAAGSSGRSKRAIRKRSLAKTAKRAGAMPRANARAMSPASSERS